ncbi:GtrA family protein [Actinocatenispora thailandica]
MLTAGRPRPVGTLGRVAESRAEGAAAAPAMGGLRGLYARFRQLIHEVAKFGVVGGVNFFVDIGLYNVCESLLGLGPLTSKTISVTVAATLAFVGNRYWTWRNRPRTNLAREYFLYFVMNAVGLLISLLCLGFSYYVLGEQWPAVFRTTLANNISGSIVGTALGTLFRFFAYRKWVFLPAHDPGVDPATGLPEPADGEHGSQPE